MIEEPEQDAPPITELSKAQRRVLGTLLEKAFTTPEAYPLTVKALTAGCNQKSNRHPLTEYSEDDVHDVLDQLRQMGLVAVVHTETGRTERFRHYMRKRFTFSEPQLAVLTELLLRGRQSIGDLRSRASRMVAIESLDELRVALRGLMEQKYLQANTGLERRGVEVDHNFYGAGENKKLDWDAGLEDEGEERSSQPPARAQAAAESRATSTAAPPLRGPHVAEVSAGSAALTQLRDENRELQTRVDSLEHEVSRLKGLVDDLVRDLRG
ncbi:MAG TPA: DUF480 domain-containing protein [Planctomycetaceae bacterium]|jgi:uncharacterized protein YceH (UPF0502 family)|nr:DUF480 domain-containing protein [Planctomycetaceae bacterium]